MGRFMQRVCTAVCVAGVLALCAVADPGPDSLIVPAHSFSPPFSGGLPHPHPTVPNDTHITHHPQHPQGVWASAGGTTAAR